MEGWWRAALCLLASLYPSSTQAGDPVFSSDTLINNVVRDPATGRVYVGAVNTVLQLSSDLLLQARSLTGPVKDSRSCTPPVTAACTERVETDNHNKLLLVGPGGQLVLCGSVFRGLCSLRNLTDVEQLLYFSDTKGEKTYVASAEEGVSVVGVMSYFVTKDNENLTVFVVGKGYGSQDSTKLISTRVLQDYSDWVVFDSIIEASAVQASPFVLSYLHDFRFVFKHHGFVYFLYSRTLSAQDSRTYTFLSRMCENDHSYYSYTELQLNCSATNRFNKVQAAYVSEPGLALASNLTLSGGWGVVEPADPVLFVVLSAEDEGGSSSGLCLYPLEAVNKRLVEIISACYSHAGKINDRPAVYTPYSSKPEELCITKNEDMASKYRCGAEFLPSPLASKSEFALTSDPAYSRKGHLTAVAVAVETEHAVAFLGTGEGEVLKLHLSSRPEVYGRTPSDGTGGRVNKNLLLSSDLTHLYVATERKISKVPVQACNRPDCQSCMSLKDPYCGWCVLESRCTRKGECDRSAEDNTWLWSPNQQCVQIQSFNPPNLSNKKTQQVGITVPSLPRLGPSDKLKCVFGSFQSQAVMIDSMVTCSLPDPVDIPPTPDSQDFVAVPVAVLVNGSITVTSGEFRFYSCAATVRKSQNTPCISCVTSEWGCQWNSRDHVCSDNSEAEGGAHVIKPLQKDSCPRFESPDPQLLPVGLRVPLRFQGRNLGSYTGRRFTIGTELMQQVEKDVVFDEDSNQGSFSGYEFTYEKQQEVNVSFHIKDSYTERRVDSTLTVVVYNCSVGREDCSLCRSAEPRFQCVWCPSSRTCTHTLLCPSSLETPTCPSPTITGISPLFGPLAGGISLTLRGSNLGVRAGDVRRITVAGVECVHLEDRYSVSTSVVCEVGPAWPPAPALPPPADLPPPEDPPQRREGVVEVEVEGGRWGRSQVVFTYRDPAPSSVQPEQGPAAGGTVITITGTSLDTATTDDVTITVGGVPCQVLSFGSHLTCQTGGYAGQKLPSPLLPVIVSYGRNTSREVRGHHFQYWDNPKVTDYNPKTSFHCGGRRVVVQGSGFDLIQRATMTVLPSTDEEVYNTTTAEFGQGVWVVGLVQYERKYEVPLAVIIPGVILPMLLFIAVSVYCYRRKSQQAEREYEKVRHQLENLEESVRDRCKKEFTDLMIEMEDHTSDLSEARIPFLDYKNYTDRNFFLPSEDGTNDVMITGRLDIPESRRAIVSQALNQFSNLLNSKTFLINFIRTLEGRPDFGPRARVYLASLLTVALHGKLEYYTDIMRTLLLELMDQHVTSRNPKLMLRRSETVVERMLSNWMSICLYQFLRDTAGEPLYKLFKAIKHQVEKGPVDARLKKAKYTLNDTGLLGDDVEYSTLTLQVLVHGEGPDVTPVKVLSCDSITQVKEKVIEQVYRNMPYSQRPRVDTVALEWRPGSTGQILSDLDLTSQKEGRWKRVNTLAHYNVRDNATLVLSTVLHTLPFNQHQDSPEERNALLEDEKVFHLVRPADELDEGKSKRGSLKDKAMTKAITEIYLTRLLSVKGTLQQFVDDFFRSVLCSGSVVPPAVKYFFDFLDEQALKHDVEEDTVHIWKTNSLPLRFWVNILKSPHFILDVQVGEVVDASLHVIAQTFMDACTKTEHKLSRESPSNKLLYAKEISTYKKMVDDYYKGIRQMVPVSDQDMNTHLAEVSRQHTDELNTQVALHQLYQYASKYYDGIIQSLEEDPAAQSKQLTVRLQQIAAALENKVTDL
ncbi:plexin-B2-like [Osmerus eperlanus]|uniref:plexin-B2-like n=1 Tax=Osmerus eperlanus TaxID=29151 RepID=UPI002E101143